MEIDKPWTWTRFKPSLCATCWGGCCHGMPVEISIADLVRLGATTEADATRSLRKVASRLRKEGWIKTFRAKKLVFVLEQKANGDCILLNTERRCTAYENRPEICRQFPKIGPKPGHCPHTKK